MSDHETAVERRLRERIEVARDRYARPRSIGGGDAADIDAGREAIALLREHSAIATNATWAAKRRALLARCEGEKR